MNIFYAGHRFRRKAPIEPPAPDHTTKHKIRSLYKEASNQRRIALAFETPFRDAEAAAGKSKDLIHQITQTAITSTDDYRAQVRSFADRAATFQCGMNILFLDPDCSLQDPKLPPPAGVNHPGGGGGQELLVFQCFRMKGEGTMKKENKS